MTFPNLSALRHDEAPTSGLRELLAGGAWLASVVRSDKRQRSEEQEQPDGPQNVPDGKPSLFHEVPDDLLGKMTLLDEDLHSDDLLEACAYFLEVVPAQWAVVQSNKRLRELGLGKVHARKKLAEQRARDIVWKVLEPYRRHECYDPFDDAPDKKHRRDTSLAFIRLMRRSSFTGDLDEWYYQNNRYKEWSIVEDRWIWTEPPSAVLKWSDMLKYLCDYLQWLLETTEQDAEKLRRLMVPQNLDESFMMMSAEGALVGHLPQEVRDSPVFMMALSLKRPIMLRFAVVAHDKVFEMFKEVALARPCDFFTLLLGTNWNTNYLYRGQKLKDLMIEVAHKCPEVFGSNGHLDVTQDVIPNWRKVGPWGLHEFWYMFDQDPEFQEEMKRIVREARKD